MSSLARWTYTNTATVYPFVDEDLFNGGVLFGEPYTIACTWETGGKLIRTIGGQSGAAGDEFVADMLIYTEDARPKYRDEIVLAGHDRRMQIRAVTEWDMSPFGEADSPDYRIAT